MTSLLGRVAAYFVDPPAPPPPAPEPRTSFLPPTAPADASAASSSPLAAEPRPGTPDGPSLVPAALVRGAVLGSSTAVVPVAAACAGELRARSKAAAALLCIWRPAPQAAPAVDPDAPAPSAQSPAGATTPGARRLAARLAAHELPATACGRLAWIALDHDPAAAAGQAHRCAAIADGPVVLAIAGARPAAFEPLLAELDLALAVLPSDIEPALRDLALATLRARSRAVVPPLAPGPPRWAAMAGLARLRSLPEVAP